MRFHGAADAYGWYRSRRSELARGHALPKPFYHARSAASAAIALADLERMLTRLGRKGQKALTERNADYPATAACFETLLREGSYLMP
ncbi:hypothetical protein GTA51_17295 [Desulfovibrio aerotolerans]|uniref:Uncharacterized protein n=1 Tax=Solidesulfovibrio aerotolerans TaxID=295255 RepID=A0A7C9N3U1_9BACT|nr:hypothetical protein [Solidesulfovibrio aerotolerans]MYL84871.1 hypothetical protein [Solidesulfovibrio aerotolerans]